eukprot:5229269-Alexandrium_andersonii.AAC.1
MSLGSLKGEPSIPTCQDPLQPERRLNVAGCLLGRALARVVCVDGHARLQVLGHACERARQERVRGRPQLVQVHRPREDLLQ